MREYGPTRPTIFLRSAQRTYGAVTHRRAEAMQGRTKARLERGPFTACADEHANEELW